MKDDDGPECVIADWGVLGLAAGLRLSEWCQQNSNTNHTLSKPVTLNVDGTARAFIADDFVFLNKRKQKVLFTSHVKLHHVHYVAICWRFQKNLDNGQVITFKKSTNANFCPVNAVLCIMLHADRFDIKPDQPLAVVMLGPKGNQRLSYVTSHLVSKVLQNTTSYVYKITNPKDLENFHPIPSGWALVFSSMIGKSHPLLSKRDCAGAVILGRIISEKPLVWLVHMLMPLNNQSWILLNIKL